MLKFVIVLFIALTTQVASQAQQCRELSFDELRSMLNTQKRSVLYTWNPHMPLSVLGLEESRKFFSKEGIQFIALLDNTYDMELPDSDFLTNGECLKLSYEVAFSEDMYNHFPGYFYYEGTKSVRRLFGYTFAERLKNVLLQETE